MTLLSDLVFRSTKGSRLSKEEGDANLLALAQAIVLYTPRLVAQRSTPITRTSDNSTDATSVILSSVTLPGVTMGLNSKLVIVTDWDVLAANTKHLGVNFGGSNVGGAFSVVTPTLSLKVLTEIQNLNSLASQSTLNSEKYERVGAARIATSINTADDVTIDFTGRWSANVGTSQTITLVSYSIYHYPGS